MRIFDGKIMRVHPERDRSLNNVRENLGLSPRARFCTVISQDGIVVALYKGFSPGEIEAEATRIAFKTRWPVIVDKLARFEPYCVKEGDGKVQTRTHGVDDNIQC